MAIQIARENAKVSPKVIQTAEAKKQEKLQSKLLEIEADSKN